MCQPRSIILIEYAYRLRHHSCPEGNLGWNRWERLRPLRRQRHFSVLTEDLVCLACSVEHFDFRKCSHPVIRICLNDYTWSMRIPDTEYHCNQFFIKKNHVKIRFLPHTVHRCAAISSCRHKEIGSFVEHVSQLILPYLRYGSKSSWKLSAEIRGIE